MHILKKAGVRYRNAYQTRHTYASMMLSQGENIMWVSKQLGHVDVEMVMKTYGRWIPDHSLHSGYRPVHNWGHFIEPINPQGTLQMEDDELFSLISNSYMVEVAGVEPASAKPPRNPSTCVSLPEIPSDHATEQASLKGCCGDLKFTCRNTHVNPVLCE